MDRTEFQASIKNGTFLVDFSAPWCGPCRLMAPIVKEIAQKLRGKAKVIEFDIDTQKNLATDFMVQSIPTLIIFKNGKEVKRMVGLQSKAVIETNLNKVL